MSPKQQLWTARIAGLVILGLLLWMLFAAVPLSQQGGQIRELGVELGQRAQERIDVKRDYAYVADFTTMQYWPNREPYASRIPAGQRVYILDHEALKQFKGYTRGKD
jgi:hypothetical protein